MSLAGFEGAAAIAAAAVIAAVVLTMAAAAWQYVSTRRDIRALSSLTDIQATDRLFTAVLTARSRFTESVRRYERAIAEPVVQEARQPAGGLFRAPSSGPSSGLSSSPAIDSASLAQLERDKIEAREQLVSAQRLWENSKPPQQPSSALQLWSGAGIMRGWNLGPIGFETVVLRVDHTVDNTCWSAWRMSRLRVGLALGAERQRLALFIIGAECDSMRKLLQRGLGGVEVAFRPGFVPSRTWRRTRRDEASKTSIAAVLRGATPKGLVRGPDEGDRAAVAAGYEYELGRPLEQVAALPTTDAMLAIHTKGPSVALGVWGGRNPRARLVASSTHTAWQQDR